MCIYRCRWRQGDWKATGRAGRDGLDSHCHLYLDEEDYLKVRCRIVEGVYLRYQTRSLAYSDNVDYPTIKKIMERIFQELAIGDFKSLPVDSMESTFDVKKEVNVRQNFSKLFENIHWKV